MSWRFALIKHVGPGGLCGCTLGDWVSMLRRNRFAIDARFWPRALSTTFNSLLNSMWRGWEDVRYGSEIEKTHVPPPLFVLGIWRSGTTHLHNLLSQDDRFAFPNTYQVLYPHSFLSTERFQAGTMQAFTPPTRPMDNVKSSVRVPQEDEFALVANGLSFLLELLVFPRTGDYYRRFLTLQGATAHELDAWKAALMRFLRKLTLKYTRPLVLKSPGHTCRIKVLLELFPNAKFVHIHRHPYSVFQSSLHAWQKVQSWWGLQNDVPDVERIIRDYVEVYDAYFDQRHLIPAGQLCEVSFDELERSPLREVQRIYDSLGLPAFDYVEPILRSYVESIEEYSRNRFPDLDDDVRQRLSLQWSRCFDEWGYAR